ncbi:hypothetical protein COB72_00010 [bacterium]|nr:MAG: hypothetical protein COB72_00010 [bacterium]
MLASSIALAADTAFTYQGSLMESGSPMTGTVDIDVSLWNALAAGSQVGSTQNIEDVPVTDGLFSLELDFGAAALDGDRWLEITINGTTLSPRQKVTASPYSIQTRGIFVDDDGQVAIGTPVPTAQLDVRSSTGIQPALYVESTSPGGQAIRVRSDGTGGPALTVAHLGESGNAISLWAGAFSPVGYAIRARNFAESGLARGIDAWTFSSTGRGVTGNANSSTGVTYGVYGEVFGNPDGFGVFSNGKLGSSGFKTFRIDHPTDPENKYLVHYSSEGPEPINEYSGNVNLGADGSAWVQLPDYFEMINIDFRYTLTAIGAPAPGLYIASEVQDNAFRIAGGKAGLKVSWEVKGRRNDPYARAYGAPVIVEKQGIEIGKYLQPQLFGKPESMGMTPFQIDAQLSTETIDR